MAYNSQFATAVEERQKELAAQKLDKLRKRARKREGTCIRLFLLLLVECVILLIMHPTFIGIDGVTNFFAEVQSFFVGILWPHDAQDLAEHNYRHLIYSVCTTVQSWPIYSFLAMIAPWILPALMVVAFLDWRITLLRIRHPQRLIKKQKPPAKPAPAKPAPAKTPSRQTLSASSQPKVPVNAPSGLSKQEKRRAERRLAALHDSCGRPFERDAGVMVRIMTGGQNTERFHQWDENGMIILRKVTDDDRMVLDLVLENRQAYIVKTDGKERVPMVSGQPYPLKSRNEAEQEIVSCVVIWLGGN